MLLRGILSWVNLGGILKYSFDSICWIDSPRHFLKSILCDEGSTKFAREKTTDNHLALLVMTEFTTDGVIDGTGPLADFQTFYFDSQFADVVRLEVPTHTWALDNMVFGQIPEPATGVLLLFGGSLLWRLGVSR